MTRQEAVERVRQIVQVWRAGVGSLPLEFQDAQTYMLVLRERDIEALSLLAAIAAKPE